jgi:predicted TIM-barrel enzyme
MNARRIDCKDFILNLKGSLAAGSAVVVAGVGSGLTAKAARSGRADIIAVYSTAVYRVRGLPTSLAFLPYDNANALTLSVLPEVLANVSDVPVLAGLGAHDPRMPIDKLLDQAQALGVDGVTNEPFAGIYGEDLSAQLEAAGLGFSREVELIKRASDRGLLTLGWTFNPIEVGKMVDAGAQFIGAMVGVTTGGQAGGQSITTLDEAAEGISAMVRAAKQADRNVMVLAHGGPLNDPNSVQTVLELSGADGYVTGSTGERIPVEVGIAQTIRQYKALKTSAA